MDDLPRQKLIELIRRYGREIAGDARRCEALLHDACPQHKREVVMLVSAAKESVGIELLKNASGLPTAVLLARLARGLHDNLGMAEDFARWAVESWASALGIAVPDSERIQNLENCPLDLHFIWIIGCSDSMRGKRIESLNFAIRECVKPMREIAEENRHARMLVRAATFSTGARWHIEQPTPIEELVWPEVEAGGRRDMGQALSLVAKGLKASRLGPTGLPPFLSLVSDGPPTDDFHTGLSDLMNQPWGKHASRVAVAIGDGADLGVLQRFIGTREIKPFQANNASDLLRCIRWAEVDVREETECANAAHNNVQEFRC
jgi:uncharacterized protein YegL